MTAPGLPNAPASPAVGAPVEQPVRPLTTGRRLIDVHEGCGLPPMFVPCDPGAESPFTPYEPVPVTEARRMRRAEAMLRGLAVELDSLLRAHEAQGDGRVATSQVRASVEPYLAA